MMVIKYQADMTSVKGQVPNCNVWIAFSVVPVNKGYIINCFSI